MILTLERDQRVVGEEMRVRLAPLPADQWDAAVDHALAVMLPEERRNPDLSGNLVATLVHHPKLTRAFLRFNGYLLYGSALPAAIRELAVLRVAHRRNCRYEWLHHVEMGTEAGLSADDIESARTGEHPDEFYRAVLNAVDELEEKSNLSDATWSTLGTRLDKQQRMDLIFTIGCYGALAMAVNTFGVEPDQER